MTNAAQTSEDIDFNDYSRDNLLSESNNVASDVLEIIKQNDSVHYQEMEELVN